MKPKTVGLFLACSLLAPVAAFAGEAANVTVIFDHPENFADVKDAYVPTDKGRDDILAELRQFIESRASSYLKEGQHLEIKFTDVDLAGDFEPHDGTRFDTVRLMKGVYPPRLVFGFKLTGPTGQVLKEGQRRLTDLAYQNRMLRPGEDDRLRYEKDLLIDWMHDDLGSARSAGG